MRQYAVPESILYATHYNAQNAHLAEYAAKCCKNAGKFFPDDTYTEFTNEKNKSKKGSRINRENNSNKKNKSRKGNRTDRENNSNKKNNSRESSKINKENNSKNKDN